MNLLFLCVMLVLRTASGEYDYNYDNSKICKTVSDIDTDKPFLECICESRENFTVDSILDFSITRIIIKGCGDVRIPFASLTNLQLSEIEFADLDKLTILPFALSSVQGVSSLKISDVSDLKIIQHAFVGLYNIDQFIVKNVTAKTVMKDAFSAISAVNLFLMQDCTFQEVQQLAFAIQNISTFHVINTTFNTLENYSLLLHNAKEVIFESCVFDEMDNGSFVFSFVDSAHFKNCHFSEIETTAFHSNPINVFSITDSYIENLKPDAFGSLLLEQFFVFTGNIIAITYETSFGTLLTPQTDGLDVNYCCNSYTCDCNIFWMWSLKDIDKNNTMLEDSFCRGKIKKPVNIFKPIMDSHNNCMTLELKSVGSRIMFTFQTSLFTLILIKLIRLCPL